MTPIRNNFLAKISYSLTMNKISNGVHPVNASSLTYGYPQTLDGISNSGLTLGLLLKAEV